MKIGKTLTELAVELDRRADAKLDVIADARSITMTPDNASLRIGENGSTVEAGVTDHCHRQIATYTGIGTRYYDRMLRDSPALLAGNVNHWLHKELDTPKRRMVRMLDDKARAFLSDAYLRLDNEHVAESVLRALADRNDVRIVSCDVTDKHLYIKGVFPDMERAVAVGDPVRSGFIVKNCEIGLGTMVVRGFIERLICTNGMIAPSTFGEYSRRHLGSRIKQTGDIEYQQDTIEAAAQAALLEVRDAVSTFSSPKYIDNVVESFRAAKEDPKVERPVAAVEILGKHVGLNERERESVLERLIRNQDYSRYGVLNAVTNLANDTESYDRASELELIGGQILDFSRADWNKVAVAA